MVRRFLGRARHEIRRATRFLQHRAVVLAYHRIAEHHLDPQLLCVTPAHFAEHLQIIQRHYRPLSLGQMRQGVLSGQLRPKSVVITFDDGYADNLWHAAPLLERFGIPATVFVTSGFVGQPSEMFTDTLERILLLGDPLPQRLTLEVGGETRSWLLGDGPMRLESWDVTSNTDPTPRHRCYRDLHALLLPMTASGRQEVLAQLLRWAGCTDEGRYEHRTMNAAELRQISRTGLVEVGAHGVWHLMLKQQSTESQRQEIAGSKEQLEQVLGHSVASFAYPYGGRDAVDSLTIHNVQAAGFEMACDNVRGSVTPRTNLFALPRHLVRDCDGTRLSERLRDAFLNC